MGSYPLRGDAKDFSIQIFGLIQIIRLVKSLTVLFLWSPGVSQSGFLNVPSRKSVIPALFPSVFEANAINFYGSSDVEFSVRC